MEEAKLKLEGKGPGQSSTSDSHSPTPPINSRSPSPPHTQQRRPSTSQNSIESSDDYETDYVDSQGSDRSPSPGKKTPGRRRRFRSIDDCSKSVTSEQSHSISYHSDEEVNSIVAHSI